MAAELEQVGKTASRFRTLQRDLESAVVKRLLRKGEPLEAVLGNLEKEYESKAEELCNVIDDHLPRWQQTELDDLKNRNP